MTTGIVKYKRYQVQGENSPLNKKWYGRTVQDRTLEFEDFVSHIAQHNSPYSRGVIHGVMTDMLDCLKELIQDGKSVRLGDIGLFYLNLVNTKGAQTREDWTVDKNVKGLKLCVRNTKTWSNAELRKSVRLQELEVYEGDPTAEGTESAAA